MRSSSPPIARYAARRRLLGICSAARTATARSASRGRVSAAKARALLRGAPPAPASSSVSASATRDSRACRAPPGPA